MFLLEKNFISPSKSGFKLEDSYVNQLFFVTQEIRKSSNDGFKERLFGCF